MVEKSFSDPSGRASLVAAPALPYAPNVVGGRP